jgi:fructose transport system substrate-binding protein
VIALDTPLDPIDAADATFATDNFRAGELIGKWAAATLGDEAANAKIGMLDLAISQPTVGVLRDQGFLTGFGIDVGDPNKWGDEEPIRASSATTSPPATRRAAAGPWKTCLPRTR